MLSNSVFPTERTRSIRALILVPGLGAGGAERAFVTLAKHFQAVEVAAIIVRQTGNASRSLLDEAARVTRVVTPAEVDFVDAVEREAEAVHVVLTWGIADLALVRKRIARPFIDVSHTAGEWEQLRPVMAKAAEGANYLAAVSQSAAAAYPEDYRSEVRIIPNGIEPSRCSPRLGREDCRRSWGIADDQPVALYLGRFSEEKRPLELIDALTLNGFTLIAAGPPSAMKNEFAAKAARVVPGRTAFPPFSTHVGDLFACADCLAMPSATEAHPLALLEAFFAKCPVVACDWPTLAEPFGGSTYRDHVWPIPIDFNPRDLSNAMVEAAALSKSEKVLNAHDVVAEHYLADRMAARWERFIYDVLKEWFSYSVFPPLVFNGEYQ